MPQWSTLPHVLLRTWNWSHYSHLWPGAVLWVVMTQPEAPPHGLQTSALLVYSVNNMNILTGLAVWCLTTYGRAVNKHHDLGQKTTCTSVKKNCASWPFKDRSLKPIWRLLKEKTQDHTLPPMHLKLPSDLSPPRHSRQLTVEIW